MLHLNRWNQHNIYFETSCNYQCLGCNLNRKSTMSELSKVVEQSRKNDIVNLYGGNPILNKKIMEYLRFIKHNKLKIRVWTNHKGIQSNSEQMHLVDEWVVFCPSPIKSEFNLISGNSNFDQFIANINQVTTSITLSFYVRAISFEWLPEFYDLAVELNTKGMILYDPSEFNKEEILYIKRFKRVKNMCVFPLTSEKKGYCFGVPNTIGTAQFEFIEWAYNMKQSIRKLPIIRRLK